ncbi:Transcription factor [Pleurotus ostreatus]|nr:Transcription factor [Pleurotus ostreatus]
MATFTTYAEAAQQSSQSQAAVVGNNTIASTSAYTNGPEPPVASSQSKDGDEDGGKKKKARRRKVNHACLYCRRSHMTCDEGRPCQRCIKREIGHLCHDEQRQKSTDKHPLPPQPKADATRAYGGFEAGANAYSTPVSTANPSWPLTGPFIYQPETLGNEFSVLTDFLETLDERSFFTPPPTVTSSLMAPNTFPPPLPDTFTNGSITSGTPASTVQVGATATSQPAAQSADVNGNNQKPSDDAPPILPAATKTEKFLLTAADQESGSRDERLNRVIRSKYEAGLLKPYNYVKGYARLSRWMDRNVSQESKSQILQPLSVLRPKFRAVAQSLRDIDLVFIEEAFERMLLDYDRVFSAMGVPACLWRRTGEIYKANREFAELVGIDGYMMRDGRLCIYELMAEESAVNYWEKYGHVAFDSSQKAVLTSCVLRYKPVLNPATPASPAKGSAAATASATANASNPNGQVVVKKEEEEEEEETPMEEGFINCCFSFTIRRDKWGIPSMIVGNFIKC